MSYRHTLEAALESLHEIEDLVKGFPVNGNIPSVEIDLALQKLRNMYELMLVMKKPAEETTVSLVAEEKTFTGEITVDREVTVDREITVDREVTLDKEMIVDRETTVDKEITVVEKKTVVEARTLSDTFKGKPTLHESLSKDGNTLAQAKPIKDIMTAIGINDRFTFIRELFNGDPAAFETTIDMINTASGYNGAYNYLVGHFNWDMKSDVVQHLLEIISRKHGNEKHE
jgi:hypothetical protein